MRKVQLTLTDQEAEILGAKASQLGYNLAKYIRLLLGREVVSSFEGMSVPTFKLTKKAKLVAKKGLDQYQKGKVIKLKSADSLDAI